jgi:hypothetical protein
MHTKSPGKCPTLAPNEPRWFVPGREKPLIIRDCPIRNKHGRGFERCAAQVHDLPTVIQVSAKSAALA